eukprot:TRINITY_DN2205_c0_g2_i13.p1 TRINITY_DN2205_c0_g2~~TRINITY_DN2205_c0_g2_i13.p1  ORF type:complete len:399 (+),score=89.44 TRINITY_DN2205_c0_g2_i13:310-1506(+)
MKMMNKHFVITKNQLAHARTARDAMVEHDYPGIVKLYSSFQDSKFLYFIMEYLPGGDLMNLLIKRNTLTEAECKFYMAEVILAVNSVHSHGYIHRDLKPDNILITRDGHVKLSDFGLCTSGFQSHLSSFYQILIPKDLTESSELTLERSKSSRESRQRSWNKRRRAKSYSTVGTSNYMAPEILLERGYDKEVDWWAVGVIIYECLVGYAPFSCEDASDTCLMIISWRRNLEFPSSDECELSNEAFDLICSLIASPEDRIGYNEIVTHPWFRGTEWENIRNTTAPWIPDLRDEVDTSNFDEFEDPHAELFFSERHCEDSKARVALDEKDLPFVGWTYRRFEIKNRPRTDSLFSEETISNQEQLGHTFDAPSVFVEEVKDKAKESKQSHLSRKRKKTVTK